MVSGILVLVGKIAFLLALYGFMLVVYRGLLQETRRAGQPLGARREPGSQAPVERWELRPPGAAQPAVRAVAPPVAPSVAPPAPPPVAPPAPVAPPEAAAAAAVMGALAEPPAEPVTPTAESVAIPALLREPAGPAPEPEPQPAPAPVPPEPAHQAALVVLTAPEAGLDSGLRLPLHEVVRLGRAEDNHVVLRDRFVSSHHAEITREAGGYVLRDLGSTNGTFRNGARLSKPLVLQEGDRIGIGTSMFTFHSR